jgi:hypothetical protein
MLQRYERIVYIWAHKICLFNKYRENHKNLPLWLILHDLDKLLLTLFTPLSKKIIDKIHQRRKHHSSNKLNLEMIYDWEVSRFTKPDKPLSALQYLILFRSNDLYNEENVIKILQEFPGEKIMKLNTENVLRVAISQYYGHNEKTNFNKFYTKFIKNEIKSPLSITSIKELFAMYSDLFDERLDEVFLNWETCVPLRETVAKNIRNCPNPIDIRISNLLTLDDMESFPEIEWDENPIDIIPRILEEE